MAALELPKIDDKVVVLTADLTFYSGLERFKKEYPDRLYNIGIAEQNMVGIAAGMAKEGLKPFATTYASFATTRCLDQVKVNMSYMNLGIKMVGLTSGASVGILGATHMGHEDIAIVRSMPNVVVLSPADCTETYKATIAAAKCNCPVYLRLTGTMNNPSVYMEDYEFEIGKAIKLKDGKDICIIATGTMVYNSLKAAEELEKENISCRVLNIHTIKPMDKEAILEAMDFKLIVTVEEHSVMGGLGSAISEILSNYENSPPQYTLGFEDKYPHAGEYSYLIEQYGLTKKQIAKKIMDRYKGV